MTDFYGISCKMMDEDNSFILSVGMWYIGNDTKAYGYRHYTRNDVLAYIHSGRKVFTIFRKADKWQVGEEVKPFFVRGVTYLRTIANDEERDNLGNLPDC